MLLRVIGSVLLSTVLLTGCVAEDEPSSGVDITVAAEYDDVPSVEFTELEYNGSDTSLWLNSTVSGFVFSTGDHMFLYTAETSGTQALLVESSVREDVGTTALGRVIGLDSSESSLISSSNGRSVVLFNAVAGHQYQILISANSPRGDTSGGTYGSSYRLYLAEPSRELLGMEEHEHLAWGASTLTSVSTTDGVVTSRRTMERSSYYYVMSFDRGQVRRLMGDYPDMDSTSFRGEGNMQSLSEAGFVVAWSTSSSEPDVTRSANFEYDYRFDEDMSALELNGVLENSSTTTTDGVSSTSTFSRTETATLNFIL